MLPSSVLHSPYELGQENIMLPASEYYRNHFSSPLQPPPLASAAVENSPEGGYWHCADSNQHHQPRHRHHHHHHNHRQSEQRQSLHSDEADSQKSCLVCTDLASGQHYGVPSCEACKAFFKRTVQGHIQYVCLGDGHCEMTKKRRKSCPACRFKKCLTTGMNPDGIRLDRRKGGRHKIPREEQSAIDCKDPPVSSENSALIDRLLTIEPGKLYGRPDSSVSDPRQRFLMSVSNVANSELIAFVTWAKLIPGFSVLSLADQVTVLQSSWLDVLCFNMGYRSAQPYTGHFVFSEDVKISEEESRALQIEADLDAATRQFIRHLSRLQLTRQEYILLKVVVLLNIDSALEDPGAVQCLRDRILDTLLEYEQQRIDADPTVSEGRTAEAVRRIGSLLLTLPELRHEVVLARRYWFDVVQTGFIGPNQLLSEMLEHLLTDYRPTDRDPNDPTGQ